MLLKRLIELSAVVEKVAMILVEVLHDCPITNILDRDRHAVWQCHHHAIVAAPQESIVVLRFVIDQGILAMQEEPAWAAHPSNQ